MIGDPMFAQVSEAIPTSPWEMITHATIMTQIVLAVLVILSLISWAIMLLKWREFRRVHDAGRTFMRDFERASSLEDASAVARRSPPSPFTRIFTRAVNFFAEMKPGALRSTEAHDPLSGSQVEALRLVLDAETTDERDRMGAFIPWLATIGSVSPSDRAARHGAWRHRRVHRDRDEGLGQHQRGGTRGGRGAHCDRGRTCGGHSGSVRVQHFREQAQPTGERARGIWDGDHCDDGARGEDLIAEAIEGVEVIEVIEGVRLDSLDNLDDLDHFEWSVSA